MAQRKRETTPVLPDLQRPKRRKVARRFMVAAIETSLLIPQATEVVVMPFCFEAQKMKRPPTGRPFRRCYLQLPLPQSAMRVGTASSIGLRSAMLVGSGCCGFGLTIGRLFPKTGCLSGESVIRANGRSRKGIRTVSAIVRFQTGSTLRSETGRQPRWRSIALHDPRKAAGESGIRGLVRGGIGALGMGESGGAAGPRFMVRFQWREQIYRLRIE